MFEFISSEKFPEDNFIKEIVYLCIDGKIRVGYVKKNSIKGDQFWSPISVGVIKDGTKKYYESFLFDSNFLNDDIKDFLYKRKWEKNNNTDSLPF